MANDHLMIKCRGCGSETLLAKYYPSNAGVWDRDKLCDWVDQHIFCTANAVRKGMIPTLCGERCFDIEANSAEKEDKT